MQDDDLDRWLEEDDDDGDGEVGAVRPAAGGGGAGRTTGRAGEGWADLGEPARRPRGGRPPWLIPTAVGCTLLVAAAIVLAGGRSDRAGEVADPADDPFMAGLSEEGMTAAATDPAQGLAGGGGEPVGGADGDAGGAAVVVGQTATAGDTASEPAVAGTAAADEVSAAPDAAGDPDVAARAAAAAVTALRARLTTTGEGRTSYLEHATPVATDPLGDGAWLVSLDATWLEGEDQLDRVVHGRWAVPVADDATVLAVPWPVASGPPAPLEADPPVGAVRLDEVAAAVADAGWGDVQALAADDHALVGDVIVALVAGTTPTGRAADGEVVWLQDTESGLVLMGADR